MQKKLKFEISCEFLMLTRVEKYLPHQMYVVLLNRAAVGVNNSRLAFVSDSQTFIETFQFGYKSLWWHFIVKIDFATIQTVFECFIFIWPIRYGILTRKLSLRRLIIMGLFAAMVKSCTGGPISRKLFFQKNSAKFNTFGDIDTFGATIYGDGKHWIKISRKIVCKH